MTTFLDYSAGTISGAAIRAAGHAGVLRYVEDPSIGLSRKHITPGEYRDLHAAGVDVWLVFEIDTTDMLAGFNAGADHARRARAGADWIGYPPGALIFFAADMHETAAQVTQSMAYVDGAISVLGHDAVGVYGFYELIDACIPAGKGAAFWQCGIHPDPADGVHIWQRNAGVTSTNINGVTCDIDDVLLPMPRNTPAAPAANPATTNAAPRRRMGEDTSMFIQTPAPSAGAAVSDWPTIRRSYGFDPKNGWGGNVVIKLHFSAYEKVVGGMVHEAKWWCRGGAPGGVGTPNQPHSPSPINLGSSGEATMYVGDGWEITPPEHADELEIVVSAPNGVHIFAVYQY